MELIKWKYKLIAAALIIIPGSSILLILLRYWKRCSYIPVAFGSIEITNEEIYNDLTNY